MACSGWSACFGVYIWREELEGTQLMVHGLVFRSKASDHVGLNKIHKKTILLENTALTTEFLF